MIPRSFDDSGAANGSKQRTDGRFPSENGWHSFAQHHSGRVASRFPNPPGYRTDFHAGRSGPARKRKGPATDRGSLPRQITAQAHGLDAAPDPCRHLVVRRRAECRPFRLGPPRAVVARSRCRARCSRFAGRRFFCRSDRAIPQVRGSFPGSRRKSPLVIGGNKCVSASLHPFHSLLVRRRKPARRVTSISFVFRTYVPRSFVSQPIKTQWGCDRGPSRRDARMTVRAALWLRLRPHWPGMCSHPAQNSPPERGQRNDQEAHQTNLPSPGWCPGPWRIRNDNRPTRARTYATRSAHPPGTLRPRSRRGTYRPRFNNPDGVKRTCFSLAGPPSAVSLAPCSTGLPAKPPRRNAGRRAS